MDLKEAGDLLKHYLQEQFGRIVELRGVRVVRRAAGRLWAGDIYRATEYGEVRVGSLGVTEEGRISGAFGVEDLINVLSQVAPIDAVSPTEAEPPELAELLLEPGAGVSQVPVREFEELFDSLNTAALRQEIRRLLASGRQRDLLLARDRLPLLLPEPEGRAETLRQMAELELLLGDVEIGLDYLEASAREHADRAHLTALEGITERCRQVVGTAGEAALRLAQLLEQTRTRRQPINRLRDAPLLAGLDEQLLDRVAACARVVTVNPSVVLIQEEAPALRAYVVAAGVLSIRVEDDAGTARFVRCCYPGDFVGESSVLGEPGATCTATVTAEDQTTLWQMSGPQLRALAAQEPSLEARLRDTQMRHRLDSFFSTSAVSTLLDVRVRDRLLSCFSGLRNARPGEVLLPAGVIPEQVYLVVEGQVEHRLLHDPASGQPATAVFGLRNALHRIPCEGEWVADQPCRLVRFDVDRLRALAAVAPPEVLGALESLEQT